MRRTLRRTAAGVSVSYSDHDFSNNLTGTDFAWEQSVDGLLACLSIDMTGNFRVRSKESANCYQDACDLAENHFKLKTVQLFSPVPEKLLPVFRRVQNAVWQLELNLGDKGKFRYSITQFRPTAGTLFMDVHPEEQ
jgi:hypothetical protein